MDLDTTFENLYKILSEPDFGDKLGGELPLFIQPIESDKQLESEKQIERLASRLNRKEISTVIVDLFDLTCEILKEQDVLDTILTDESSIDHMDMIATMDSVLDISSVIIPKLQLIVAEQNPKILLISGVGHVFPFIRSHGILNNIDELTEECKLVLFFPGEYNNQQLKLFDRISDENYYRGHNLNDINC